VKGVLTTRVYALGATDPSVSTYDIHLIRVNFWPNPPVAEFHSIVELKKDNMNFLMSAWFSQDASNVYLLGGVKQLIPEAPSPTFY
jgi:hypothetical protein